MGTPHVFGCCSFHVIPRPSENVRWTLRTSGTRHCRVQPTFSDASRQRSEGCWPKKSTDAGGWCPRLAQQRGRVGERAWLLAENPKPTALPSQGAGKFWAMAGVSGSVGRAATAKPSAWDGGRRFRAACPPGGSRRDRTSHTQATIAGKLLVAGGTTTVRRAACEPFCACGPRTIPDAPMATSRDGRDSSVLRSSFDDAMSPNSGSGAFARPDPAAT